MGESKRLHLFDGYGIELEYMIVDAESLAVLPAADRVIHEACGAFESEIERGEIAWSNELVLHVIELKTNGPAAALDPLPEAFDRGVAEINAILEGMNACLLPTAMHPWMNPFTEMRLWPHEYNAVYEAFNRIFDCRGHGWANLQSMHLNLPFADDSEFGKLHAAIRMLLPILPALAASSPVLDGETTGLLDNRLEVYRTNSSRIPSTVGAVIPEPVYTREHYEREILGRIYRDIAPYDPDGTLRHEFVNARGAIARFDRYAIEIRVLDVQECPLADLAIASAITSVLRKMIGGAWLSEADQRAWPVAPLEAIFRCVIGGGEAAVIEDRAYLDAFAIKTARATAGEVWRRLLDEAAGSHTDASTSIPARFESPLAIILDSGTLSRRILRHLGRAPSRAALADTYRELARCLREGRMFAS